MDIVKNDLKQTLEGMIVALFGEVDTRWVNAYFPFTEPSYELEIYFEVSILRFVILRSVK